MRAALIYQHATSERDHEIAAGMDKRIAKRQGTKTARAARRGKRGEPDDGSAGSLARVG